MTNQTQTTTTTPNMEGDLQAALAGHLDRATFQAVIERVNWSEHPPVELMQAIQVALQLELIRLAYRLAETGHQLFPEDPTLATAAHVIAPPKIIAVNVPPRPTLGPTMQWLRDHSHEYSGLWVALYNGELLGTAKKRAELVESLNIDLTSLDMLTRIP